MACEMRYLAESPDIVKCKQLLSEKDDRNRDQWLQECLVSISPTGEILVLANSATLIVFSSEWDPGSNDVAKNTYNLTWQGIPCYKSGDITGVLCLPISSNNQSSYGADWTCIVVGFSSGTLKFFTESMQLLATEILHCEPILQIKCDTFKSKSQGISGPSNQDANEFIYVLYKTVLCVLNAFSLFQTLRGYRSRISKQGVQSQEDGSDFNVIVDYKKYGFSQQDAITDVSYIGQTSANTFDHLLIASLNGGFNSNYRPSPPLTSLIIATGRKPFLAFHYTIEGGGNPVLTDVALAVASKIKESVTSSLPGWFGFGGKTSSEQEKNKISQEPAEQLGCRFGLCDLWRHGNSIITSPDGKFSAVADTLGRIMLIENSTGIARRLWKGYRDGQCAFLEVEEDTEKSRHKKSKSRGGTSAPRKILFIVLYAPRRGTIEVYTALRGLCVASFRVSNNGRLIYLTHGLSGTCGAARRRTDREKRLSVIFLSEDGVKEIIVPFHCGLRSDNSNRARDVHMLKKMKLFLKEGYQEDQKFHEEMKKFAGELKTDEGRMQVIEMLMANKQVSGEAFTTVLNEFICRFRCDDDDSQLRTNFASFVETLEKLIAFYVFTESIEPRKCSAAERIENDFAALAETLLLTNNEVLSIVKLLRETRAARNERDAKISFKEENRKSLSYFLSCFDFGRLIESFERPDRGDIRLSVKHDLREDKLYWIGELLFEGLFRSPEYLEDWKTYVIECDLEIIDLIKCLLSYWLNLRLSENSTFEIASLVKLLKSICALEDPQIISVQYNQLSPWWSSIREYLKSTKCLTNALLAAAACRSVTITTEQMKELMQRGKKGSPDNEKAQEGESSGSSEWENVSRDTWVWDMLIMKLEDAAWLNSILKLKLHCGDRRRPEIDFEIEELSLNSILERGNGFVSEIVGKWIAHLGLEPYILIDSRDVEFQVKRSVSGNKMEGSEASAEAEVKSETETFDGIGSTRSVMDHLRILKEKFPYSLTSSALLCNVCWEYMGQWETKANDLSYLESGVDFLRCVPAVNLKHRLSYVCWSSRINSKFSAVAKLINKFGKVPKDKFCVQEINLTNLQVPIFLKLTTELLSIILELEVDDNKDGFVTNAEGLWQNEPIGNAKSLVATALSQPKPNEDLVILHYQLSMSLHMISELNLKVPKLFSSLFDNVALTELFTDLTKKSQLSSHSGNAILTTSRKQFLYKVIGGAVQTIEVVESIPPFPTDDSEKYVPGTRTNVDRATRWLHNCFELARMWDIPLDDLRRQHVCELYSCGFDRLAEEIIPAVNEYSILASQMLVIAGERLKTYLYNSDSTRFPEKLSNLCPNLSSWLQYLDSNNLKNGNVILSDLETMVSYIVKWQPEKQDELQLAVAIAESIPSLENDSTF